MHLLLLVAVGTSPPLSRLSLALVERLMPVDGEQRGTNIRRELTDANTSHKLRKTTTAEKKETGHSVVTTRARFGLLSVSACPTVPVFTLERELRGGFELPVAENISDTTCSRFLTSLCNIGIVYSIDIAVELDIQLLTDCVTLVG